MGQALSQESNVPITRYVYRVQIPNTRERSGVAWLLPSSRRRCSAAKTELVRSEHNSEPSGDRAAAATGTAEAVPHPGWTRMRTQGFVAVERLLALCALGIALGLCISAFRGPANLQVPDSTVAGSLDFSAPIFRDVTMPDPDRETFGSGRVYRDGELSAVVAESGIVVKFGDATDRHDPRAFDVFWSGDQEHERAAVHGIYGPDGQLRVTADGWAALTASRLDHPRDWRVALYSTDGAKQWEHALPKHLGVRDLAVHPTGSTVIVAMSEFRMKHYQDHVLFFTKSGPSARLAASAR